MSAYFLNIPVQYKMRKTAIALALLLAACSASAQVNESTPLAADIEKPLRYGAERLGKRQDADMRRFRDNRLGAFIHWGLYAIPGGEWDGKVYPGAAEWLKAWAKVPADEWLGLMEQWNPVNFKPREWADMARRMGVKYVKITTKHHEGFCLWPSKYTKYTVANTPYKKDILGELVKAFNEQGIDVHLYFSVLDWSHPDYRYDIKSDDDAAAYARFLEFTENQLRELATNYPTVKDFWFDGTWDASMKKNAWWTARAEKMLKELVPGVTVNSRLRADDFGKRHFDSNGHLMGDYESGYERRLPDPVRDTKVTRWDWEACMTLPENQWGYHKDWSLSYVKSPVEVIERIVHAVSMGGNMVVNFGPQADGDFRPEEKLMAQEVGRWMKRYGECIYGCDYAGWDKQPWGYYTRKGDDVYMAVFNVPYSRHLTVVTPKNVKVTGATLIGGKDTPVTEAARNEYLVDVPENTPDGPFVIKLRIEDSSGEKDRYRDALT
jgi:alpha-L-fucosidase